MKYKLNTKLMHELLYINWQKDAERINVSIDEGDILLDHYKEIGIKAKTKTCLREWKTPNTYSVEKKGFWTWLYVNTGERLKIFSWHIGDDTKNDGSKWRNKGKIAMQVLNAKFKSRTGKSLYQIFGYSTDVLRKCVGKAPYFTSRRHLDKVIRGVYKVDYSSNYPFNMRGKLPTIHGAMIVPGVVEPSEEFPFAFYLSTGHSAELGRYDTRKWNEYKFGFQLLINKDGTLKYSDISEEDQTLLCPIASIELTPEMEHFYDIKKKADVNSTEYEEAKHIMNNAIGYMHPATNRQSYRLFHVAAVAINRAGQQMLELLENVDADNVLHVAVDGVITKGKLIRTDSELKLGALKSEIEGADFIMRGNGAYMFFDKDGSCIECKHGGYNSDIETSCPFDIFKWRKVKKDKKEVLKNV